MADMVADWFTKIGANPGRLRSTGHPALFAASFVRHQPMTTLADLTLHLCMDSKYPSDGPTRRSQFVQPDCFSTGGPGRGIRGCPADARGARPVGCTPPPSGPGGAAWRGALRKAAL